VGTSSTLVAANGTLLIVAATSSTARLLGSLKSLGSGVITATRRVHRISIANAGMSLLLAQVAVDTRVCLVSQVAVVRTSSGRGRAGGI